MSDSSHVESLQGRTAIISGGSQGLGLEIARKYVAAGASVVICARNEEMLTSASETLSRVTSSDEKILSFIADVSQHQDVMALIDFTVNEMDRIDVLINNAGIYGPKGVIEHTDWEEWVQAININLLGSVLMCRAVVPHMKAQGYGKIIQLSGGGATSPLPNLSSYAVAKAGIVRFVETLAAEVESDGIDVNAIAPGALNTRMLDEILDAGPDKVGQEFYDQALRQNETGGASLEKGAKLAVFLGSAKSDGITGKLISALWDPWSKLAEHRTDLKDSDIYTLRRIVPSDRGLDW